MFDSENWREIFDSIRRHKLRTTLTALGIFWGIFMLVLLLGAGKGLQNGVEYNFRDDAVNSIWMYPGNTSKSYNGLPVGRFISLTNDDYFTIINEIAGAEHVSGRYYLSGNINTVYKDKSYSYRVRCIHPGYKYIENVELIEGRFINDKDLEDKRKVTVIGRLVRDAFFGEDAHPIGEYLNIGGVKFEIVGVYKDSGNDNENRMLYLPLYTAQSVFGSIGNKKRLNNLMFTMGDATVEESMQIHEEVYQKFAEIKNFDVTDNQALYVRNNVEEFQTFRDFFAFIEIFVWIVGIGTLIAGVIGISNIMLIVVKDRTKEIGIRKALGATPRSILTMIVQESIFITSIAGYLGMLAGVGLIYLVNTILVNNEIESQFFRNPEVNLSVLIGATLLLVICGALAGLIPAMRAVKISPVIAMKS